MTNLDMFTALVGTLLPVLIAKVQAADWTSEAKALFAATTCVVVGGATAYFQGEFVAGDVVRAVLITFTFATVTYNTFWKPSGIAGKLNRDPADIRTGL